MANNVHYPINVVYLSYVIIQSPFIFFTKGAVQMLLISKITPEYCNKPYVKENCYFGPYYKNPKINGMYLPYIIIQSPSIHFFSQKLLFICC